MEKVKTWSKKNAVCLVLIALIIFFGVANKTFLTVTNIINITSQMSINALLTIGITFVIIIGGIDISVGSVAAFAGIFSAYIGLRFQDAPLIGILGIQLGSAIFIGTLCGLFIGVMVAKFNVVPMIATLAVMQSARGLAYVVTDGQPVYGLSDTFAWLGSERLFTTESMKNGVLPVITIFMIIILIIMHILLSRTVFGRHVYAVGSNEKVARLSGISVDGIKIKAHVLCSIMAALGGVCVTSKLNNGQPAACDTYEMYAIAATVLGGTSLLGGTGSVLRAMFGCAIIAIINNGMNLMQISSYWQKVIIGMIILLAVVIDMAQKREKV